MIKPCLNKKLSFFLVVALLTAQWAVAHIHLAEHHSHDGNHHQHNIQVHSHSGSTHHADTIDSVHEAGDYNFVEIENNCTSFGWKTLGDQLAISTTLPFQFLFIPKSSSILLSAPDSNHQSFITYSTIRLRAPPQFS